MPNVSDVMSPRPQVITPQDTLHHAAELMTDLDVGALPVCDGERLVGMLTDRDIVVRGIAAGRDPDATSCEDVMSRDVRVCTADQDTEEVMRVMGEEQVRRMPVVDTDHRLVGIVAMADLALRQPGHIDETVRQISEPGGNAGSGGGASGLPMQ